jgi:hypothetical protein
MTPIRTKNAYSTHYGEFYNNILVVCPNCARQGLATPVRNEKNYEVLKVVCTHCGFSKLYGTSRINVSLWLRTNCEGHLLWAYNHKHLNFLQQHIEAVLRERNNVPKSNKSIGSRLPRWMVSGKNRNKVLKGIEKLRQL